MSEGGLLTRSFEQTKEAEGSGEDSWKIWFSWIFPSLVLQGSYGIPQQIAFMVQPGIPCLWEKAVLEKGFYSLENDQGLTCQVL